MIKKQTDSELEDVMSSAREAYASTAFLSYFFSCAVSISYSRYYLSCSSGDGDQCSPFVSAAVFCIFGSCSLLPLAFVWTTKIGFSQPFLTGCVFCGSDNSCCSPWTTRMTWCFREGFICPKWGLLKLCYVFCCCLDLSALC